MRLPIGSDGYQEGLIVVSAALPTGKPVAIEFMPKELGAHQFTCQMGMLRGQILVEAA